ncbi:hypothetical protein EC973_009443 [Apophysomyces ossiformis]|uniref:Uncharacterized protein n=1 Tax=Apophysomyces ossiformis TaxID=679940 RepID=A0A8H7ET04_9FUNG|nr:hypothetical protein EC973_009443 [Apophysomyces ossiformis]
MSRRLPWLIQTRLILQPRRGLRETYRRNFATPAADDDPRGGRRGAQTFAVLGAIILAGAGIAYYNAAGRTRGEGGTTYDAYQNPFLFLADDDLPHDIRMSRKKAQESTASSSSSNPRLQGAKQAGNEALDHAQAASQHAGESISQLGKAVQDTASDLRQETKRVTSTMQHRATGVGRELRDEARAGVQELKHKADEFRAEHHLKSGSQPPEDVLSHVHDPNADTTILGRETNAWVKEKTTEAVNTLEKARKQTASEMQDWKENAQQKSDELQSKWQDAKEGTVEEAKRRAEDVNVRAQQTATVVQSGWQDVKDEVTSTSDVVKKTAQQAGQDAQSLAEQAKENIQQNWVDLKQDTHHLRKQGEERVQEGVSRLKEDARWLGDKAKETGDWIRGEADEAKAKVEGEQRKQRWAEQVRRGEGWAEEEADNLRPTRQQSTSSDTASEATQKQNPKSAETIVHGARSSKL